MRFRAAILRSGRPRSLRPGGGGACPSFLFFLASWVRQKQPLPAGSSCGYLEDKNWRREMATGRRRPKNAPFCASRSAGAASASKTSQAVAQASAVSEIFDSWMRFHSRWRELILSWSRHAGSAVHRLCLAPPSTGPAAPAPRTHGGPALRFFLSPTGPAPKSRRWRRHYLRRREPTHARAGRRAHAAGALA